MNGDYNQEYRSYGSYLSRIIAIIVAFALLVVAVWFVVRLASNDDDPVIGDATRNVIALDEDVISDDESNNDVPQEPATDDTSNDSNDEQPADDPQSDTDDEADQNDQQDQNDNNDDNNDDQSDEVATATDTEADNTPRTGGQVLSTNTDELPTTGGELGFLVVAPVLAYFASRRILGSNKR